MKKVGPKNPFSITDERAKPATEAQVKKLEKKMGAKLPKDYRRFLLTINGGCRTGSGWELPKRKINIDRFNGLRADSYDLNDEVDRVLKSKPDDNYLPPDTIVIAREWGDNPIVMKYRGKDAGSIWYWDEMRNEDEWRKIAPSFDALIAMLHQEAAPPKEATIRSIIDKDDVAAARRYVDSLPPDKLDEPDELTGHSLLQRAVSAGAVKVVALLIDRGARKMVGIGSINQKHSAKIVELLLTRGEYLPTKYDWQGVAAFAGIEILRLCFKHAPMPPKTLVQDLIKYSNNHKQSKPSKERDEIIKFLEKRLALIGNKRGSVRKWTL